MDRSIARRRRAQGMTEYIVIVGLVALLLIAGVSKFGFAVDEAIQGTALAMMKHEDPNDYPGSRGSNFSKQVGFGLEDPGKDQPIFLVSEGTAGSKKWVLHYGSATGGVYKGSVTTRKP